MSANIDSMMYVGETPWHGLGTKYETAPTTSKEIIEGASLGWTVSSHEMNTDIDQPVIGYHGIYRDDAKKLLGVVRSHNPIVVQNEDTFVSFEHVLGNELDIETAASLGSGEQVFGCFKLRNHYQVLGDDIDHYFVVLNDHLKVDGKVTVFNTPVRVVCQNTLSAALSATAYKVRIPITEDPMINQDIMGNVFNAMNTSVKILKNRAEKWATRKIDRSQMDLILNELFPYPEPDDEWNKKNDSMQMQRDTFIECMEVDNLDNFRGTVYQVFNALVDYETHYFKNPDKGFDLNYRMKMLPGMGTEPSKTSKFLKMQNKMFA